MTVNQDNVISKLAKGTLSVFLAGSMLLGQAAASVTSVPVWAGESQETEEEEKYISDVFIAYGKTEQEAVEWLKKNGWEPIRGNNNFDSGKHSESVAAAMGIRRTNDSKAAITDMAVMNMDGGYSFPDYETILNNKRAEIDSVIDSFLPAIDEYRQNYNGQGSVDGQTRAQVAYDLLNNITDGGPEEEYPANDTEKPLGELFLDKFIQEGGPEGSGDLEQIFLESTGSAVAAIETAIAMATDVSEDSWMDRLSYLTEDELAENIAAYIPGTEGIDVAPSSVMNYYMQNYGDTAALLADRWDEVHESMLRYEAFETDHDLCRHEGEDAEAHTERYNAKIAALKEEGSGNPELKYELDSYLDYTPLYLGMYGVSYSGEWGATLGDFFNPRGDDSYSCETERFLPIAVALSEGERSALPVMSFSRLLMLGLSCDGNIEEFMPDISELLGDKDRVSVYAGSNRGIFRGGVALTSEALMQMNKGEDPYSVWDFKGAMNILLYSAFVTGVAAAAAGAYLYIRAENMPLPEWNVPERPHEPGFSFPEGGQALIDEQVKLQELRGTGETLWGKVSELHTKRVNLLNEIEHTWPYSVRMEKEAALDKFLKDSVMPADREMARINEDIFSQELKIQSIEKDYEQIVSNYEAEYQAYEQKLEEIAEREREYDAAWEARQSKCLNMKTLSVVMMSIGAILIAGSIIAKTIQCIDAHDKYYNRNFTPIPRMIVDEADIVNYAEDEKGEMKKVISLEQFKYYTAVRCNRQAIGEICKWQKGVKDYCGAGCGDLADLNVDHGKEWLALYTVKSEEKGFPILADSLKLVYADKKTKAPAGAPNELHYFTNLGSVNIADTAYCFENASDKKYIGLYWDSDKKAA